MIELYKHIEVLLLENDCVIVPGLGGFIAHYRPAVRKDDGRFLPPLRAIGFNPQLVMNDGLLVQSYMQAYNTDFPDATRKIEKAVEELKVELYQNGEVSFGQVGVLYYNMNGVYEFAPSAEGFFTPSLYGLGDFRIAALAAGTAPQEEKRLLVSARRTVPLQPVAKSAGRPLAPAPETDARNGDAPESWNQEGTDSRNSGETGTRSHQGVESRNSEGTDGWNHEGTDGWNREGTEGWSREGTENPPSGAPAHRLPWRRGWQNVAAAVAAVLLFFVLSVPVENTYIDELNYASLGSASLFEAIRSQSMASCIMTERPAAEGRQTATSQRRRNNMNTLKPVTVRTEQVETVPAAVKQKGTPAPAAAAAPKNAETKNTEAKNTGAENAETKNNAGTRNAASQTAGGKNVPQSALATAAPATTAKGNAVKENGTAEENAVKENGTAEENAVKGSGAPKETPKPAGRTSYVIVASLTSRADAEQEVKKLAKDGWPGAVVVESDGKFRVALSAHSQAGAAYQRVNELKKTERFRTAWVFTTN